MGGSESGGIGGTVKILPQDFDMNIEKMYKLLFNDDSSVQSKMKDLQKMTEYEVLPN